MKETIIVNLIGGQGTGKSTLMAEVFSWLKWHNIDSEMCTEFAKELIWEKRDETFKDELYIFAKQNHRLSCCNGKVNVIITDRPLIMSVVFNEYYGNPLNTNWNKAYNNMVVETYKQYNNLNFYLKRVKPYNTNGRNETFEQAKEFDNHFLNYLIDNNIDYIPIDADETAAKIIGKIIAQKLQQ